MLFGIFSDVSTIEMVLSIIFLILSTIGVVLIFKDVIAQLIILYNHSHKNKNIDR